MPAMLPANDQDFWCKLGANLVDVALLDIARIKGPRAVIMGYGGFQLHYYKILDPAYLQKFFKSPIASDNCYYCETEGPDIQGLHQDVNTRTALNLYLATTGDTTEFYQYDGELPASMDDADEAKICLRSQFVAQPGDAYVLNVHEWHLVRKTDATPRRYIQWGWDADYATILPKLLPQNPQ